MPTEVLSRDIAIGRLRAALLGLGEEGKSMCQIAAERNILCGGFHRYTDEQLNETYRMVDSPDASLSREELEARANEWQVQRAEMEGLSVTCDVQVRFYETCRGWNDFTNEALAEFLLEIAGEQVTVVGARTFPEM